MNRHPNWHRRVLRYGIPLTILSGLVDFPTGAWISTAFLLSLAVAFTRDFLMHRAQQRLGCVCDWNGNMRFVAIDGCPHHGKLWPYHRPPPPQGVALRAALLVTTTTAMAVLLLLGLARIM